MQLSRILPTQPLLIAPEIHSENYYWISIILWNLQNLAIACKMMFCRCDVYTVHCAHANKHKPMVCGVQKYGSSCHSMYSSFACEITWFIHFQISFIFWCHGVALSIRYKPFTNAELHLTIQTFKDRSDWAKKKKRNKKFVMHMWFNHTKFTSSCSDKLFQPNLLCVFCYAFLCTSTRSANGRK